MVQILDPEWKAEAEAEEQFAHAIHVQLGERGEGIYGNGISSKAA